MPSINQKHIRFELYQNYINELYKIEGLDLLSNQEIQKRFKDLYLNPYLKWLDVYPLTVYPDMDLGSLDMDPVGFIVIGSFPECHPDADHYIVEAYIQPDYRRKKIMFDKMVDYIQTYGGKYCLFVASKNEIAKEFWNRVFKEVNYVPMALSEDPIPDPHFIQFGYQPSKANMIDDANQAQVQKDIRLVDANALYDIVEAEYKIAQGTDRALYRHFLDLIAETTEININDFSCRPNDLPF